jgi:hypothetical protein
MTRWRTCDLCAATYIIANGACAVCGYCGDPKTLTAAWSPPRPDVNSGGEVIAHYRSRLYNGWRYTQRRAIGGRWEDVSMTPAGGEA